MKTSFWTPGATDSKCTSLAGGGLAILPSRNLLRDSISPPSSRTWMPILGATSGSVSTFRPKALWRGLAGRLRATLARSVVAATTSLKCDSLSMSIIQDGFTGAIVSGPISMKPAPPLDSFSCHQLSLSRAVIEASDLLQLLFPQACHRGRTVCLYPSSDPLDHLASFGGVDLKEDSAHSTYLHPFPIAYNISSLR
ncbi:hypothetical protein ARMSODRAFT_1019266 [Armillaria solidipes]|uniref:Uncharacterized protein n=1 Tax=Armillaria solidipes TaxID=1076256 RepID=A0A2H3BCQ4_9AGAR|nr:hypothetical protein ARMSODRAFT_1019266 [Armillaria solidipes]